MRFTHDESRQTPLRPSAPLRALRLENELSKNVELAKAQRAAEGIFRGLTCGPPIQLAQSRETVEGTQRRYTSETAPNSRALPIQMSIEFGSGTTPCENV